MVLDTECIRDVMTYLADHINFYKDEDSKFRYMEVSTTQLCKDEDLKSKYEPDVIVYTVLQLYHAGFLVCSKIGEDSDSFYHIHVRDITWNGHEFLGNIKSETVWTHTKACAKKLGISSVKGIFQLAGQVTTAIIADPKNMQAIQSSISNVFR